MTEDQANDAIELLRMIYRRLLPVAIMAWLAVIGCVLAVLAVVPTLGD